MKKPSFTPEDDTHNGEEDEPNKLLTSLPTNSHFEDVPLEQNLLESDDGSYHSSHSNNSFPDTPRTKLTKCIPDIPFKINRNNLDWRSNFKNTTIVNGGKSFHVSLTNDTLLNEKAIFSKSCDYSVEISHAVPNTNSPIVRSLSEDYLQTSTSLLQRRISMVSSSKGKLLGVSRARPGEKCMRSPSCASQTPFGISKTEEDLPKKIKFTAEQKWIAFCLCLVDFTAFLAMSIIAPFFPREAAQKGMREAVSGFVFSIYALIVMLTSPIFGKILPKVGAKFMFLCGIGFSGACNILFGVLDKVNGQLEFTVLCFLVRSFEALGAAAFCTASCTILIDQFPDNIGTIFGFTETSMGIGMSIGPAIGGALYAVGGFGLPFFFLGGFVILVVPLCWYLLRNVQDPEIVVSTSVSYKKLLSMPHVIVVCVMLAVVSQAQAFIDPTLEPHMRQYNLDASIIGLLFLLLSGAYALSAPVIGWISGRVENKYPIMIVGMLFVGISLCLLGPSDFLPFEGNVWISIFALVLLGISLAAAYIPTFESIFIAAMNGGLDDDINTYSVVSGLWNSVFSLGEVTGPSLGGILSDFFTFPQAATVMALCTLGAFVIALISWYNPWKCFGKYSLVEDAVDKAASTENQVIRDPSREHNLLANGKLVHSYGSLWEDKKNPMV